MLDGSLVQATIMPISAGAVLADALPLHSTNLSQLFSFPPRRHSDF